MLYLDGEPKNLVHISRHPKNTNLKAFDPHRDPRSCFKQISLTGMPEQV